MRTLPGNVKRLERAKAPKRKGLLFLVKQYRDYSKNRPINVEKLEKYETKCGAKAW